MPRGLRQTIPIGSEAFLLSAWRDRVGAHDRKLTSRMTGRLIFQKGWYPFYNIVVLKRAFSRMVMCHELLESSSWTHQSSDV